MIEPVNPGAVLVAIEELTRRLKILGLPFGDPAAAALLAERDNALRHLGSIEGFNRIAEQAHRNASQIGTST